MNKCLKCNKNCEKEYCWKCKPRKPLPKVGGFKKASQKFIESANDEIRTEFWKEVGGMSEMSEMNQFFLSIWNKRFPHNCYNCGRWLGSEPLSYMFDHLLEKSKYPNLKYEEENICYLCLECHDNKTRGFISQKIQNLINKVKEMFGIL